MERALKHFRMQAPTARGGSGRMAALAVMLLCGGCASYFGAEVTAYHQAEPALPGLSFRLAPDAQQENSLEFQTYAAQVRQALLAHGLRETGSSRPDVRVALDYTIDHGRPVNYSQPNYAYVFQGYRQVAHQRTDANGQVVTYWETEPLYGYDLVGYSTYQRTVFRKQARVTLTSTHPLPGRPARLYEGTVVSDSEDSALNNAVPLMLRALFQDFPGPNGVTHRVEIRTDGTTEPSLDQKEGTARGAEAPSRTSVRPAVTPSRPPREGH